MTRISTGIIGVFNNIHLMEIFVDQYPRIKYITPSETEPDLNQFGKVRYAPLVQYAVNRAAKIAAKAVLEHDPNLTVKHRRYQSLFPYSNLSQVKFHADYLCVVSTVIIATIIQHLFTKLLAQNDTPYL